MKHLAFMIGIGLVLFGLTSSTGHTQEELRRKKKLIQINWKNHQSKNYDIHYEDSIPLQTVKKIAKELEEVLVQYKKIFKTKFNGKFTVKYLESQNTFEQEGGSSSAAGMYIERGSEKFLLIKQMNFYKLLPVVYHEAMHQYLAMWLGEGVHIPTWFTEGLASFYENIQRDKHGRKQLNPDKIKMRSLRMVKDSVFTRQNIPLEKLVDSTHQEFHAKDNRSLYYNQSFSVIYYFMKVKKAKPIYNYMNTLKKTKDVEKANEKLFGKNRKKMKKTEAAWKNFLVNLKLSNS